MEDKRNISIPTVGMNKDASPHTLTEQEYTFAYTALFEDKDGRGVSLINEASNILCTTFKAGYVVVKHFVDIQTGKVYFFLHNPTTGSSEIGVIEGVSTIQTIEDLEKKCKCNYSKILDTPLEDKVQEEGCTYTTILKDDCNKCLNFSLEFPIRDVVLKKEEVGDVLYFSGDKNAPRRIELFNLTQYKYYSDEKCDDEAVLNCEHDADCTCDECEESCPNCEKMLLFQPMAKPCYIVDEVENGGNLKTGVYQFVVAYCDQFGNEMGEYYSATQPCRIFDANNNIINQTNLADETNYAIKLAISGLDKRFSYFKIAVIQTTTVDQVQSYFEVGVYSTDTTSIVYTTSDDKKRTTLENLYAVKPNYTEAKGMMEAGGFLYLHGLKKEPPVNLQPVVSLMGAFLRWQVGVANENLYKNAEASANYAQYMRNENYPFSVKFFDNKGQYTNNFVLIHRPPTTDELSSMVTDGVGNNNDVKSILAYTDDCDGLNRSKKYQFYNTATTTETLDCGGLPTVDSEEISKQVSCTTAITGLTSGSIDANLPSDYVNFEDFVNRYKAEICDNTSEFYNSWICSNIINKTDATDCTPTIEDECTLGSLVDSTIQISAVENESVVTNYKALTDYLIESPSIGCQLSSATEDTTFKTNFIDNLSTTPTYPIAYVRPNIGAALTCSTAPSITGTDNSLFVNYLGDVNQANLQTSITTGNVTGGFTNKIHKQTLWLSYTFPTGGKGLVEISKNTICNINEVFDNTELRVSILETCSSTAATESYIVDLTVGKVIEIDQTNYSGASSVIIAIDAPIRTETYSSGTTTRYFIEPPCGCFSVTKRDYEIDDYTISWDSIDLVKQQIYAATCVYSIPQPIECEVVPYKRGKFGYVESIRTYPDNKELFDSHALAIKTTDIPSAYRTEFEGYYVSSTDGNNNYTLNNETKFYCKPIRHYKMPSNEVCPFMNESLLPEFHESIIFPLGVWLDNDVVNAFLDIAVKNNLITQEKRDSIVGYEILRGDRTLHKSIIAKGISFDTYTYDDENGDKIHYPNYPYNSLGKDINHLQTDGVNISHPYSNNSNKRYTFHSPDTHFIKPTIPSEMEVEGHLFGRSRGSFLKVEDHPKYVVLGKRAYATATTLAVAEAAFELAIRVNQAILDAIEVTRVGVAIGDTNPLGITAAAVAGAAIATAQAVADTAFNVSRKRFEWIEIFKNLGRPNNFAHYYTSQGWYNWMDVYPSAGNKLRGLTVGKYLKGGGRYSVNEKKTGSIFKLNNEDRESSVLLSTGAYSIAYDTVFKNFDNYDVNKGESSRRIASEVVCDVGKEFGSNIASQYVSLKEFKPEQYGDVADIKWINTGKCINLSVDNECSTIYGGDTFISRMSLKRKLPLFLVTAMGQADFTPFAYKLYDNIGKVNKYVNFEIELAETDGFNFKDALFPDFGSDTNLDCDTGKFYKKDPSKFYLYYYGLPQFLVESEINCHFRYARREPHEWFYPNGGASDYKWWTQEKNVPIKYDNEFNINSVFHRRGILDKGLLLPSTFDSEYQNKVSNLTNSVIVSQPDETNVSENDPWTVFKPFNIYEFDLKAGRLVSLNRLESNRILARFTDGFSILNRLDSLEQRFEPTNAYLGVGVFKQRPFEFSRTDLGYAGGISKLLINCEYGYFWVDNKRGQILKVSPNGEGFAEISARKSNGQPSGMRNWFKEHLPFKILNGNILNLTEEDLDNSYNGIGMTGVWDSRAQRVIFTKRDYVALEDDIVYERETGKFYVIIDSVKTYVSLSNTTYFKDVSFTISYYVPKEAWVGFHPYKPNYYVAFNNYFQSGYNTPTASLWSHHLTNKSYQVFNGQLHPWIVEVVNQEEFIKKYPNSVEYWLDVRRYHDKNDFAAINNLGFNKGWVYNNTENSGNLSLVTKEQGNRQQQRLYPRINGTSVEILQTPKDKTFTFTKFFNRVKDPLNNLPLWKNDDNGILQTIDARAFSLENKRMNVLRGDWNIVRLQQDVESRYRMEFKWAFHKNNVFD